MFMGKALRKAVSNTKKRNRLFLKNGPASNLVTWITKAWVRVVVIKDRVLAFSPEGEGTAIYGLYRYVPL